MIETIAIDCPYCGERFTTTADVSAGSQSYVEDCAICCRPIEIALRVDENGELTGIDTRTDRD
ncbi:CPXCG motif-containing cysteine-rich protein [Dokdonella sp.]|uniref:CPXCG motif-containing cysteine-rich protein n=1 Tax=Dokdonella sp. TaxID=2291710 RepID=UPI001B08DA0A|nr:CPXCG motif-containing cysteine-rich protein [Dokdonella sp.]MBO9664312.1 CPXCG motif-containing cysteine-rich protein [Dokdonella sp.]